MAWKALFGERSTTKIVGVFEYEKDALSMMERLKQQNGLRDEQVQLVYPNEKDYGKKLEPETRGIARTAVRAHSIMGLAGLFVGILIWGSLYAWGGEIVRSSPVMAAVAILFFSTAGGLMLGGLITARPDHEVVILRVRDAVSQGKWSLIVHPRSSAQRDQAQAVLSEKTDDVQSSI